MVRAGFGGARWTVACLALLCRAQAPPVTVTIEAAAPRQTIDGFGASMISPYQGSEDTLTDAQKTLAAKALLDAVRINLGNVDHYLGGPRQYPGGLLRFKFGGAIRPAQARGFYPGKLNINAQPRLKELRATNYGRYLDEVADTVLEWVKAWERDWGAPPGLVMPFNEPTSGNKELGRSNGPEADREMADILKRAGRKLRDGGYSKVRFVFPNQETIKIAYTTAQAVLADPEVRQYIGRIGYHEYPYGSPMSSVKKILARADGEEGAYGEVKARTALAELARSYGIPLWMTEVSHAGFDYRAAGIEPDMRDFRVLRGRANHIHEELAIAGASAFFAMNDTWSRTAHALHFKGRGGGDGEKAFQAWDDIVVIDQKYDLAFISGTGYAIGHYARWITPGRTNRLEASTSDPLLRVTAFRDDGRKRHVMVLLNNGERPREVLIRMASGEFRGRITGEQSTASAYWRGVPSFAPEKGDLIRLTVPPFSVTTLADRFDGPEPSRTPVVEAGQDRELQAGTGIAHLKGSIRNAGGYRSWVLESGPAQAAIENRVSEETAISGLREGVYAFRFFATSSEWRMGSAAVRLTVVGPH